MRFKRKLSHRLKRVRAWLGQVILLGRTDWRKASDDAKPPRLTQSERDQLQPAFEVSAIKPRIFSAVELAPKPSETNARPHFTESGAPPTPGDPPEVASEATRVRRRRRRSRSQQNAVNPLTAFSPEKLPSSKLAVFAEKLFGWRR